MIMVMVIYPDFEHRKSRRITIGDTLRTVNRTRFNIAN